MTLFAIGGTGFSSWMALGWSPSWIAASLFLVTALLVAFVSLRPAIEIRATHLAVGQRLIAWKDIAAVDQTRWRCPLVLRLTLANQERFLLIYAGESDAAGSLRKHVQRLSRYAKIDGVPHRQWWGEPVLPEPRNADPAQQSKSTASPQSTTTPTRYPVLRPEDEEEVERMFQRLKSAGRIESKNSDDK